MNGHADVSSWYCMDQIVHVASPMSFAWNHWAEVRDGAVQGTINLLQQASTVPSESSQFKSHSIFLLKYHLMFRSFLF